MLYIIPDARTSHKTKVKFCMNLVVQFFFTNKHERQESIPGVHYTYMYHYTCKYSPNKEHDKVWMYRIKSNNQMLVTLHFPI